MSEFDEMDLDEDELDSMRDPDDLSPEDVFSMVMIDKHKMAKVSVALEDEDGDAVDLTEVITELLGYMKDKMAQEEGNQFMDQIMPLISQSVVSCLGRMIGIPATAFHLSQETTRHAILWSMCMSFLLLKYVQKHNLKIFTQEEPVEQEEIDEIERKAQANKAMMMGAMMGQSPQDILQHLKDEGQITDSDLEDMLGGVPDEHTSDDGTDDDDEFSN